MKRLKISPRKQWQKVVEEKGFIFHTIDDVPYWDESVCYEFSSHDVDVLESATTELHAMCVNAAQYIIDKNLFHLFGIPEFVVPLIKNAWDNADTGYWSVYGRFDLLFDGVRSPKLLEFNADTPTSLFESAVIQWYWLQDYNDKAGQFNSIDEKLVAAWKWISEKYNSSQYHFACLKDSGGDLTANQLKEDLVTTSYILDCASRVEGLQYQLLDIGAVHHNGNGFVDEADQAIETMFKLYPWEMMVNEAYGKYLPTASVNWIEPIWKMLWSNKALLPVLWQLYPHHKNLLPAFFDSPNGMEHYVKKPILSREGANITIIKNGETIIQTEGVYGKEGFVYQEYFEPPCFDNNYPVIGSWVVGGESAGIGIRENSSVVTDNLSRFVPHFIG